MSRSSGALLPQVGNKLPVFGNFSPFSFPGTFSFVATSKCFTKTVPAGNTQLSSSLNVICSAAVSWLPLLGRIIHRFLAAPSDAESSLHQNVIGVRP